MALVHRGGQRIRDPGPQAHRRGRRDAEVGGDLVGGAEADAADVAGEPVGVLRDDLHGVRPVGLVDAHRPGRADLVRVQEQHDLAHRLLLGPARDDAGGAPGSDAADAAQAARTVLDHPEHALAEGAHELAGVDRTDAADHPRGEILLDALERGRGRGLEEPGAELQAVDAVVDPRPARLHRLAGRDQGGVADHRDGIALPAHPDAQDAAAVVGVVERDALDLAGEVLGPRLARALEGGGLHPSPCGAPHRRAQPDAGRATTSASRRLRQSRRRGNDDAAAGVSPAGPSARRISRTREEPPMSKPSSASAKPSRQLATPTDLGDNARAEIAAAINTLLADTFALYLKTKNFHWHMSGPHFRDYHMLLDEQSDQIFAMTDVLAERVRKLGALTLHGIGEIGRLQRVRDNDEPFVEPTAMLAELREDNSAMAHNLREAHEVCDERKDVGTAALLEVFIDETERRAWFLFEAAQGSD